MGSMAQVGQRTISIYIEGKNAGNGGPGSNPGRTTFTVSGRSYFLRTGEWMAGRLTLSP